MRGGQGRSAFPAYRLRWLDRHLDRPYGAPAADLDNKPDRLDEAVSIIVNFQTDIARFRYVSTELRPVFPKWEDLDKAPVRNVAWVLRARIARARGHNDQAASPGRGDLAPIWCLPGPWFTRFATARSRRGAQEPALVNLVVQGQRTCLPLRSRSDECPTRSICATGRFLASRTEEEPADRNDLGVWGLGRDTKQAVS